MCEALWIFFSIFQRKFIPFHEQFSKGNPQSEFPNRGTEMMGNPGSKPFICDFCNRGFARKDYLDVHRRIHTGEKPYACQLCSYRAAQQNNLKIHIRSKHQNYLQT